jgi:hypothetical protein
MDCHETTAVRSRPDPVRLLLAGLLLPLCWLGMMVIHEAGHVAGALLTGGRVVAVVLHPLAISRTDVAPNPHPNVVAWSGPVAGVVLPIGLWQLLVALKRRAAYLLRFFAGFCLVANGLYLGIGSFDRIGDAGDLLRSGSAMWQLWLCGVVSAGSGFALWNRQAAHFGSGPDAVQVERSDVAGTGAVLLAIVALELMLN